MTGSQSGRRWPAAVIALLVVAGAIKSTPIGTALPVDLTVLCAGLISAAVLDAVAGALLHRERLPLGWILGAALFGVIGLVAAPTSDYADTKIPGLFGLTLGCAFVGAIVLVRSRQQRITLIWATVATGLFIALLARVAGATGNELVGRVALGDDNTIAPARAAGAALVAVVLLAIAQQIRVLPAVLLAGVLLALMVSTGSRGPLVAVVLSLGALIPFLSTGKLRVRALILLGAAAVGGYHFFTAANGEIRSRLLALFSGDDSIGARQTLWRLAWHSILDRPLGVGWAGLEPVLAPIARYPHDILLEITAEGGVLALVLAVIALAAAGVRAGRAARGGDDSALGVLALSVFWVANASVSGDLNDNRGVFIFVAVAIAIKSVPKRAANEASATSVGYVEGTTILGQSSGSLGVKAAETAAIFDPAT